MSKARYPYDNAPMERYFNTLKNDCVGLYSFRTEDALYQAVAEFAYVTYNHVHPHSYNGYKMPYQAHLRHNTPQSEKQIFFSKKLDHNNIG